MTREEASATVSDWKKGFLEKIENLNEVGIEIGKDEIEESTEIFDIILFALRPASREKVEKVWRGEWMGSGDGYADGELVYDTWTCSECGHVIDEEDDPDMLPQFCPKCYAAMTDEAVQMVMERMEALKDG